MPRSRAERLIERLAERIAQTTRLKTTPRSIEILERVAPRRAHELGVDLASYVSDHVTAPEIHRLVEDLTFGETHFFRGTAQIQALREHVLPEIVKRRTASGERVIRVLSAGCAGGEEPYSIAILLDELLPNFDGWSIAVAGVDINQRALDHAEAAVYTAWSLRGVPTAIKRTYFEEVDGRYRLLRKLRRRVSFHRRNIATEPLPAPELRLAEMDLVLCRNVLFHFETEVQEQVVESLAETLTAGGWLLVGGSDLPASSLAGLEPKVFGDVALLQRKTGASAPFLARASLSPRAPARLKKSVAPPRTSRAPRASVRPAPAPPPVVSEPPDAALSRVVALADSGDVRGSVAALERILGRFTEDARVHLLHGLLLLELGALDSSLESFRRAIYLDGSLALAHSAASVAARRLGDARLADRHAARVRALEQDATSSAVWEGMTAGRLAALLDLSNDQGPSKRTRRDRDDGI